MYATKAELVEREKDHRDIPQTTLAAIFGVEPRNLFKWTELFRAYGIEGLMSHGGRGRKPKLSYEEMERVIKKGQEGGGFQSSPEDEAGSCGACREEMEAARAKEAGEKRPPRGAQAKPAAACGCARGKGKCEKPRRCKRWPGRACKCPCCRDPVLPRRGTRRAARAQGCGRPGPSPRQYCAPSHSTCSASSTA